jgi:hypothetical protein
MPRELSVRTLKGRFDVVLDPTGPLDEIKQKLADVGGISLSNDMMLVRQLWLASKCVPHVLPALLL